MIISSGDFSRRLIRTKRSGAGKAACDRQGDRVNLQESMSGQMHTLASHLQTVREEERMRIAREIHDELGQVLAALKMDLSWIRNQLPPERRDLIAKTQCDLDLIGTAVQAVKRICTDLRPCLLDTLGLGAAIEWKAEDFQKRNGIPCSVLVEPEDLTLDKERTTALFRIFQEALTNIVKHAGATEVHASLLQVGGQIVLEVSDNGVGVRPEDLNKANSFGLLGMRERVLPWKGKVTIGRYGDRGTMVRVVLSQGALRKPGGNIGSSIGTNGLMHQQHLVPLRDEDCRKLSGREPIAREE